MVKRADVLLYWLCFRAKQQFSSVRRFGFFLVFDLRVLENEIPPSAPPVGPHGSRESKWKVSSIHTTLGDVSIIYIIVLKKSLPVLEGV